MQKFGFFRKIGAIPINRNNPRSALTTLQEASGFLGYPGRALYFYPQGKMTHECDPIRFEGGLSRLSTMVPDCDFVPIAVSVTTIRTDKPELFIRIGEPVDIYHQLSKAERTVIYQNRVTSLLRKNQTACRDGPDGYSRIV